MTRQSSYEILSDVDLESLPILLANGYNDKVRAFTNRIQTNKKAVQCFENVFDRLNFDGLIDWTGTPSQEASIETVEISLEEMKQFLSKTPPSYESYVLVTNHGHEATFEIGWLDPVAGSVVWDRWACCVDDPVMAFADIGFMFGIKEYQCAPRQTEKPEPPLYRYHPERFNAYRNYTTPVSNLYRQEVNPSSGILTVEQLNEVMLIIVPELNQRSMNFPRKLKQLHPQPSLTIEAEQILATAYGRFIQAGRQIMDFAPTLTEMLAKTDIDDIPLNSIKLPYASQYIHFGPQEDLELEPGWLVDGAYVEQRGISGDIRFTITAVPHDHSLSQQWYLFPEVEYSQDFVGDFRLMNLAEAIDTMLSDRLTSLREQQAKKGGDITASIQNKLSISGISMHDGTCVEDIGSKMAVIRNDIAQRRFPVYKAALKLVINALCYVTAYSDDIEHVWPEGTPYSLKQKAQSGKNKEQKRAQSKLAALGYVPVHICGKRISEQRSTQSIHAQEPGHITPHWRRGHWRNQVHGPARSQRKLIWVMPVIVGAKSHKEPETGHIYQVSSNDTSNP
ncbi:hypothetical protein [Providencia rettgeri]|uniref:hypothetical protein n=1 Tax=Providencia rettgeri TaxID=587 RepID=UPI0024AB42B3